MSSENALKFQSAAPTASAPRLRVVGSPEAAPAPILTPPLSAEEADTLEFARAAYLSESRAILAQIDRLDRRFSVAARMIADCRGRVVATGMGKAGLIARKVSATLSSTGAPSHFLHPGEAFHGDLGAVCEGDVVLAFSYSGETEELTRLTPIFNARGASIIAIVSRASSALGRAAAVALELGQIEEADALRLAPSSSAAAMLAVGDALALSASRLRGFRAEDFARFHPGGALGRKLSRVEDVMRPLSECRVADVSATIREIFVACRKPGRRAGAILLVDSDGRLAGIFTDSDLAKLFETRDDSVFDRPIAETMTRSPKTIAAGAPLGDAVAILAAKKISELPVLNADGAPIGLVDVTDLVDFFPREGK